MINVLDINFDNSKSILLDNNLQQLSRRVFNLPVAEIPEIETEEQLKAKKNLTFNSTYHLFNLIKSQLTLFLQSQKNYNFDFADKLEQDNFIKYLQEDNYYQKKITEIVDYQFTRPNTICLITKNKEGNPIINLIPSFDIKYIDNKLLVISLGDDQYRVIEYMKYKKIIGWYDYTILLDKKKQKIIESPTLIDFNEHYPLLEIPFKKVGLFNYFGDIKDSVIFNVVEKLKVYQRDNDNFEVAKLYHAFPQKISIGLDCPVCGGLGFMIDKEGNKQICPACKGKKVIITKNTSETLVVPSLTPIDAKAYMSTPIQYAKNDIASLNFMVDNIKELEETIIYFSTGLKNTTINTLKTATEVIENKIPLNKRNNDIAEKVAEFEDWLLSVMAQIFSTKFKTVKVEYEKFYVGKIANDISLQIQDAIKNNMPEEFINELKQDLMKAYYPNKNFNLKTEENGND